MPLPTKTQNEVVDYVLRDLVPDASNSQTPFKWFVSQFGFILDTNLKNKLGEAFYQARLMEKVREALGLKEGFNHAFVQFQILQYASIYEAVIDYKLDQIHHVPEVKLLIRHENLARVKEAFGSATRLTYTDATGEHELIPCRKVLGTQKLKEIQFAKRLKASVKVGIVPSNTADFIENLYEKRNCLHLINAAAKDYKPLVEMSKKAFESMRSFLNHVKSWSPAQDV